MRPASISMSQSNQQLAKHRTAYDWIGGRPVVSDETNFDWVMGRPLVVYEYTLSKKSWEFRRMSLVGSRTAFFPDLKMD